jgi:hypothetical protein
LKPSNQCQFVPSIEGLEHKHTALVGVEDVGREEGGEEEDNPPRVLEGLVEADELCLPGRVLHHDDLRCVLSKRRCENASIPSTLVPSSRMTLSASQMKRPRTSPQLIITMKAA